MTRHALIVLTAGSLASAAAANPVDGFYQDAPNCDNHGELEAYEELGNGALFPMDELIEATASVVDFAACEMTDDAAVPSALVTMTNLSGRDWTDLFYVADPETRITNVDGLATTDVVPGADSVFTEAFRIDREGDNRPLIAESGASDGIFSAGETWEFIIQDYSNSLGLGAADFTSLDFAGGSSTNFSTGSIVAFQIPAPGAGALFGLAGLAAARRRR